jgi:hypothetical protein
MEHEDPTLETCLPGELEGRCIAVRKDVVNAPKKTNSTVKHSSEYAKATLLAPMSDRVEHKIKIVENLQIPEVP